MEIPLTGILCAAVSFAWPFVLDRARGIIKSRYVLTGAVLLIAAILLLSIVHPYIVTDWTGDRPVGILKTRWLAYFLVAGLLIHVGFSAWGVSRGKRIACVIVATVCGFFVLTGGMAIA